MHRNQTRMEKTQNYQHQDQKVKNPSKNRKKTPRTPKGPSSVEDIKAKMQASIEKVSKITCKKLDRFLTCPSDYTFLGVWNSTVAHF